MLMARWLTRWTGLLLVHAAEAITGTWSDRELLNELPRARDPSSLFGA